MPKKPKTAQEEYWVAIVDERKEQMVSLAGGKPKLRMARFLKPSVHHQLGKVLPPPPLSKHLSVSCNVNFRGWRFPQKKWKQWVDQLSPTYAKIWKEACIYDAIISSTYKFSKDTKLVLGLAEFWCPDTNTFVFSWGEATMTLEDMLVIGGFSVLGKPPNSPLTGELINIEEKIMKVYIECARSSSHKADHSSWTRRFMGSNSELEHVAFLVLWLSRYVFPTKPVDTIRKNVFSAAIHLSRGTKIALAPAVLQQFYRDLRVLKKQIVANSGSSEGSDDLSVSLWAPFQIMQLWAWERIPTLGPKPNAISPLQARAGRWCELKSKAKLESVKAINNSPESFQWRPYSNWEFIRMNVNEASQSFGRCVMPCELVGLDCIEQYPPHRVAMQFGYDQDIPRQYTRVNSSSKVAWRTYDKPVKDIKFCIPPQGTKSGVTAQYYGWWNKSIPIQDVEMKSMCIQQGSLKSPKKSLKEKKYLSVPPGFSPKRKRKKQSSSDEDKLTLSELFKHGQTHANSVQNSPSSSTVRKVRKESPTSNPTNNSIHVKDSMQRTATEGEDMKSLKSRDASVIPSMTHWYPEEGNKGGMQVRGLELEARIDKLERVFGNLKKGDMVYSRKEGR